MQIGQSQEARKGAISLHRKIELKKPNNKDFGLKFPDFQKRNVTQL